MDSSLFGYSMDDFKEEAKELLSKAEDIISGIKDNPGDAEGVNALFRAIHSLKGSAAYVGLAHVNSFSHLYESFLGDLRSKKYKVTDNVLNVLIRSRDYLEDLIFHPDSTEAVRINDAIKDPLERITEAISSRKGAGSKPAPAKHASLPLDTAGIAEASEIKKVTPFFKGGLGGIKEESSPSVEETVSVVSPGAAQNADDVIVITITHALKNLDLAIGREVPKAGEIKRFLEKLEDSIVWAFGDDAASAQVAIEDMIGLLGFSPDVDKTMALKLKKGFAMLSAFLQKEMFKLSKASAEIPSVIKTVETLDEAASEMKKPEEGEGTVRGASREDIVKITVRRNVETLNAFLGDQNPDPSQIRKVLTKLSELNAWAFEDNESINENIVMMENILSGAEGKDVPNELKIRAAVLKDIFFSFIGDVPKEKPGAKAVSQAQVPIEAVVRQKGPVRTGKQQGALSSASSTLKIKSEDLESLITKVSGLRGLGAKDLEVLQSATLQLRMVPVGELFSRFKKVVRDLSEELGKPIRLEVSGEGVKIDKAIADKLSEPLLHMVRNAASHGIESPRERSAAKKDDGVIRLNAYQEGGRIIIEVSDDGKGISASIVGKKAVKTGLLREEDLLKLTDRKILDFIFAPGFSTHEGVDKVSGRGVGMDVVKSVVASLQGAISIETQPGKGTCFRLELPLTLAIIRAMVLESGGAKIAVPASAVDRILNMTEREIEQGTFLDKNRNSLYLADEGEVIPIVDFPGLFGLKAKGDKRCVVLLKVGGGHKVALSVDAAVGRHPLTVKPLDGFSETGYFSSASLLDEELVLILNIPSLMAA